MEEAPRNLIVTVRFHLHLDFHIFAFSHQMRSVEKPSLNSNSSSNLVMGELSDNSARSKRGRGSGIYASMSTTAAAEALRIF